MIGGSSTTRHAFDRHANTYDREFSALPIAQRIRAQVWQVADDAFKDAARILDLGCGTGEDAIHFARKGIHVTAVDESAEMLARLKSKRERLAVPENIACVHAEMNRYSPGAERFDGLISNFGALNCLRDLSFLCKLATESVNPGSCIILTTMGRIYPLEVLVYLLKGDFKRAMRRFGSPSFAIVGGVRVDVYYHSVRSIGRMLGSAFRLEQVMGLCSLAPAPGWEHLQRSRLIRALAPVDHKVCRSPWTASLADHFVSVWRYVR